MELECKFEYVPTWIMYRHGEWHKMLYGPWAGFYRAMVKTFGEEEASERFWRFFDDPVYTLKLEKSDHPLEQVTAQPQKGN